MESKDKNFDKNISRLVKQTYDINEPTKQFKDSLIEGALGEITKEADQSRDRKDRKMKLNWKKTLAWAACFMVVCGVLVSIILSSLPKMHMISSLGESEVSNDMRSRKFSIDNSLVKSEPQSRGDRYRATEYYDTQPAEITYTQHGVKKQPGISGDIGAATESPEMLIAKADKDNMQNNRMAGDSTSILESDRGQLGMGGRKSFEAKRKVNANMPKSVRTLGFSESEGCFPPRDYPMAHGGTQPPNGEDVDAQFFKNYGVNPFIDTEDDHLSTFATDVDTGSYTIARRYLNDGLLPPDEAVRVEEFVNYFKYGYKAPQKDVFAVYAAAVPWKFGEGRRNSYLLRLGLKGKQVSDANRKPAILTFVIDVSGSMDRENRLGMVKKCLRMLVDKLKPQDKVGIAVYGSRGRKVMSHHGLNEKTEILTAIDSLCADGSTYAEEGIRIGYEMAEQAYRDGHINRVILCSDGVANVGQTGADGILEIIRKKAEKGITLSAIGFGMGNYNDVLMEQLGDKGNGHYIYIDTIDEAKKVFEDNLTGTLEVIARDVKVQVDFNPDVVRSYRLIGYENRDVPDDKFRDDKYDGGEVGAGHSVTALYELKLWPGKKGTIATSYVRYKDADTYAVSEFKSDIELKDFTKDMENTSSDFQLAVTAAEFAEILRKSYWARGAKLSDVLTRAEKISMQMPGNADAIELVDLISKANRLMGNAQEEPVEIEFLEE